MKQRRLLEQALAECQDDHISSLLVRFIRANETVSCPKFDLAKIVAKDTDYHLSVFPGASGVLHKDGVMTATNFAVVCCIEASYNSDLEGKIVDPDGDIFEGGFPEFDTIIPPDKDLVPVDLFYDEYWNKFREGKIQAKSQSKELAITVKDCCGDRDDFYSPHFLHLLSFRKAFPEAKFSMSEKNHFLIGKSGNSLILISPMNENYDRSRYVTI